MFQSFVRFTDKLKGRIKLMLTIHFALGLLVFLYFIVVANKWIKVDSLLPNSGDDGLVIMF